MAASYTPEQSAIMALQTEVAQLKTALQTGASAHDALQRAHEALNNAAQAALADKDVQIRTVEDRLRNLIFRQNFDLLDSKDLKPENFKGRQPSPSSRGRRNSEHFATPSGQALGRHWSGPNDNHTRSPTQGPADGKKQWRRMRNFMITYCKCYKNTPYSLWTNLAWKDVVLKLGACLASSIRHQGGRTSWIR